MKFKFNGDQDCPDWVLAEIATISRLTSVKTHIFTNKILQNLLITPNTKLNPENGNDLLNSCLKIDTNFTNGDVKACIAVLSFILLASGNYIVHIYDRYLTCSLREPQQISGINF